MTIAQQLFDIFYAGCTHYAMAQRGNGNVTYYPVEGEPTLDLIEQHLRGEVVLGAYTVLPGNIVRWMAFDIDSRESMDKAKELTQRLVDCLENVNYLVEASGGKGYHVFLLFMEIHPAVEVRALGNTIRENIGAPVTGPTHMEVFPKQDRLTPSNPLGNLVRLPLGQHPGTHNRAFFLDPYNGWENAELPAAKVLDRRVALEDLLHLTEEQDPRQQIINLLLPYWITGQRHDMALYTSGYLASLGWTEDNVKNLIEELHEETGEGDLENQLECVTDTFQRLYRNESVVGFQGLSEILPSAVLRQLAELAGREISSPTIQVIDRIRLGKGAQFLKVRTSAKSVISYFKEQGKLVQDDNCVYWLNYQTRELLTLGGIGWDRFMHSNFGLNPLDSFGKQVMESVKLFSQEDAQLVKVHKRSFWSGTELVLSLGGPEVYVLDGIPGNRKVVLNGENGILFLNSEDHMHLPNLMELDVNPISPWSFLTDDLSFSTSDNVNATPMQQRELLKAMVMSTFFAQTMPTRPILTLLAPSGAGKTTTARRILRLLEGPGEEVLGLVQDKPDSLRSSLMAHKILVLDNLEKVKASWLTDMLNRVSTGSHIEIRKLYETNEVMKIVPDCFVIITATEMPFSEETVFTRMLPIELAPLSTPRPEYQIQVQLLENYNALWKGMLDDLDKTIVALKSNRSVEAPNESRLADFTVFCSRIRTCPYLEGNELMGGLSSLVSRQRQVLQENSPFIQALEVYMRTRQEDAGRWSNVSEINANLQRIANANRIDWRWNSAQGLARHMAMLEQQLIRHFGMSSRSVRESNREIRQYRFERNVLQM